MLAINIILVLILFVLFSIDCNLTRIANAIEKQNGKGGGRHAKTYFYL